MRSSTSSLLPLLLALALPGCFVVDKTPLEQAKATADAGSSFNLADMCGDPNTNEIDLTPGQTKILDVDTTNLTNPSSPPAMCIGPGGAPGNDGFYMLQVVGGQYYHFHVHPITAGRNPVVYMATSTCDASDCWFANRCGNDEDEHFGFRFPADGTYYLAIDDKNPGGGKYEIAAVRPSCGNGIKEHGEGCDYAVTPPDPNCDMNCRVILSGATPSEVEINDDVFWANSVSFALGTDVTVSALINGCDTDAFAFVASAGEHVVVTERPASGTTCRPTHPDMTVRVVTPTGITKFNGAVPSGATDGCLVVDHMFLPGEDGTYFVLVEYPGNETDVINYKLDFSRQ